MKSSQLQPSEKYFLKPYANHFNNTSKAKIQVKNLSSIFKTFFNIGFDWTFLSSIAFSIKNHKISFIFHLKNSIESF